MSIRSAIISAFGLTLGAGLLVALAAPRAALWHVVQACLLDHATLGRPFPCLLVDISKGRDTGYAVLRSPTDDVKVIVTPTVRTIGVEDPRLRGPGAPNYFADAWAARDVAIQGLSPTPSDDDIALALNSKPGRSQDQLHIHVACMWPEVKDLIDRARPSLYAKAWIRLKPLTRAPVYVAHFEPGRDLSAINVVDLAIEGLKPSADKIADMTIVVAATAGGDGHPPGFTILARGKRSLRDEPHGEALLDQNCALAGAR